MINGVFITGTDTGVGKTLVAITLLNLLYKKNVSTVAMKPVASGGERTEKGLVNEDAIILQNSASVFLPYNEVNPYVFEEPIAPHIAAKKHGVTMALENINTQFEINKAKAEFIVVEGVGGWKVPINNHQGMDDVAKMLNLPVILVVGLRLGCLNHALLTCESIINKGLNLVGWVGNNIEINFEYSKENIHTLKHEISAPLLGVIPYMRNTILTDTLNAVSFKSIFQ